MSTDADLNMLLEELSSAETAWVRLAASREQKWEIRFLEVVTGEAPPGWRRTRWVYPRAMFLGTSRSGETVANWLRNRRVVVRPHTLSLEGMSEHTYVDHRESGWGGLYEPLNWPSDEWRVSFRQEFQGQPPEDLVADQAPSFITFDVAAACLLGVEPSTTRSFDRSELSFRTQDLAGRLTRVQVRTTEVEVTVEGANLRGAVLELAGNTPGPTVELKRNSRRSVKFPLQDGINPGNWIVMRRGDRWVDRRFLSFPYATRQQTGVDYLVEPSTRVGVLVSGGEGPTTEFKVELPSDDEEAKRKVMKTVAAFANGAGGSILFGVGDDGEVVGLSSLDSGPKAKDRLSSLIRDWVSPAADFDMETVPVAPGRKRRVLILNVKRGGAPPYGVGTHPRNIVYYLRRGATSFPIGPHEVRELARARPDMTPADPRISPLRR